MMLKSVLADITDLRLLMANGAGSKNLIRCLHDVNESLLSEVITILNPFDAAPKLISTDHRPTVYQAGMDLIWESNPCQLTQFLSSCLVTQLRVCYFCMECVGLSGRVGTYEQTMM